MSFLATLKSIFRFGSKAPRLSPGDRMLICADCHNEFVFDAGEQRFFKTKGFTDPKRCPRCRKRVRSRMRKQQRNHHNDRGGGQGGGGGGHRGGHFSRRHSVIEGDSPYVDER